MRHYNIPIFVPHQGCPFQCVYCDQKIIASQQEAPTIQEVSETIERHLSTIPPEGAEVEIAFFGGSFTAIERELQDAYLQAAAPYLKDRVSGIRLSTRPDCIDHEILEYLGRHGVNTIELGVQSLDDEVLELSARGYQAADVVQACRLIKAGGFKLGIQLMIGLPGDNRIRDLATTEQAIALAPDMVRIYPTVVIAGTWLDKAFKQGRYLPLELDEAVAIGKDMYLGFIAAAIPVIRMGLQAGEELRREGSVVAGPFHPSFGELVRQAVFRDQAELLLERYINRRGARQELKLWVNPRDLSLMTGQRRSNIDYLVLRYGLESLPVAADEDMPRYAIGLSDVGEPRSAMVLGLNDLLELIRNES